MSQHRRFEGNLVTKFVDALIAIQVPFAKVANAAFYGFVGVEFYKLKPDKDESQAIQVLRASGLLVLLLCLHYTGTIFTLGGTVHGMSLGEDKLKLDGNGKDDDIDDEEMEEEKDKKKTKKAAKKAQKKEAKKAKKEQQLKNNINNSNHIGQNAGGVLESKSELVNGVHREMVHRKKEARRDLVWATLLLLIYVPLGALIYFALLQWSIFSMDNLLVPLTSNLLIVAYILLVFRKVMQRYAWLMAE